MKVSSYDIAKMLEMYHLSVSRIDADKVHCHCPFRENHSGGMDKHPSFAFIRSHRGYWYYKCLACGEKGSLGKFVWDRAKNHRVLLPYGLELVDKQGVELPEPKRDPLQSLDYAPFGKYAGRAVSCTTTPASAPQNPETPQTIQTYLGGLQAPSRPTEYKIDMKKVERWRNAPVPEYALGRGFTEETHRLFGLGNDERNRRWVFPVCDEEGEVVGYTGRLYWDENYCFRCGKLLEDVHCKKCRQSYVKYKHSPGQWRRHSLFGLHLVMGNRPLVVVEGTTDVLALHQKVECNPIAILGSEPNRQQAELMKMCDLPVIIMGDGDEAGRKMNKNLSDMLKSIGVEARIITLPEGKDPDSIETKWLVEVGKLIEKTY